MENQNLKEHLVYIVSGDNTTPVAILYGDYRISNDTFTTPKAKTLDVREIIPKINDLKDKEDTVKRKILKDIREVLEDPNQTEITMSNDTVLPFGSESGATYYLMPKSMLQARGSLRITESGVTQTRNGLHVIYIDGNVRIFLLLNTIDVFIINANVAIDVDCRVDSDYQLTKQTYGELIKSNPSMESIVSIRSLYRREKDSIKRRTPHFILYQSNQEYSEETDIGNLVPIGYILGDVFRQEMNRDQNMFPQVSKQKGSIRFYLANSMDPKIRKDINFLQNTSKSCTILGSNRSNIIIFGCANSGIWLSGYWSIIVLTNQIQVIKDSSKVHVNTISDSEQTVIKIMKGSMQCLIDTECSYMIADSLADFNIETHQPFDNEHPSVDDNKL